MADSAPSDNVNAPETVIQDNTNPCSDASVVTNVIVNSPIEILPESKEFFVLVEICAPKEDRNGNINVMKHLKGLLWTIWNCYTPGVIMYDKDNKHISRSVIEHMKTITHFQKHFGTLFRKANENKPARNILVIKLKSPFTLYEIKRHEDVDSYIHDFNIYLREHHFLDYTIDTSSPGWLLGKHPQNHNREDIKKEMIADFKLACPTLAIPFFHISPCSPSRREDSGRDFQSHALAIHVDRKQNRHLQLLLKSTYNREGQKSRYVPWEMKKHNKEGYRDAMVAQSTYVANCWAVPIHGITEEQMNLLRPLLLAESGIDSVERTKYSSTTGRWDVLCKKLFFRHTQASVRRVLEGLETIVPPPQAKLPFGWKKWSDLHKDKGSSKGEQSFMTTSARSFASIVTDIDRENESIQHGVEFDMSLLDNVPPPSATAHVPTAVVNTEVTQEMLALKAHIKQQDKKIAKMEAFINSLSSSTPKDSTSLSSNTTKSIPPSATPTSDNKDQHDRMSRLEDRFERMMNAMEGIQGTLDTVMDDRPKREHDDLSTAANSFDQASKKTDQKQTPTKPPNDATRPSFEEATKNLFP
jgi:hypothetical protein